MSKKFKSRASSSRAAASGFGFSSSLGSLSEEAAVSSLTYVAEPPDLSRIAEPQLVVAFKNLLKRDDITKAKALEDLKDYILSVESRNGTVDDGLLEAWIKIYPRMSIEISRRVRQLAHFIQGYIASLAGKRIARHLPKVVGAWLAGLYDNDRPVLRSAQESLTRVFPTEEKRNSVWKIYQTSILEFVDDVTLQQTALTLSDERTVNRDDAEAKYARVAATAILLFNRILSTSSPEDLKKDLPMIETLLSSASLWAFAYHEDPFVRRATYSLLRAAISKEPQALDWKVISTAVIGKSLPIAQIGSASDLSEVLLQLTQFRPKIWTVDYSGKSPVSKLLRQYIQRGSQGASSSYWSNLNQLLRTVPREVLAGDITRVTAGGGISFSEATSLMEAFRDGLNSRDEPRQNLMAGWTSYIETGNWLLTLLPEEDREKFIQAQMSPLIEQYILMNKDQPQWTLPTPDAETICRDCFVLLAENGHEATLQSLWMILTDKLLQAVKLSSPEQSRDFKTSQDSICTQARHLFTLQEAVVRRLSGSEIEPRVREIFEKPGLPLLENSLHVLRSRNGKPYGAAAVVEEAIRNMPQVAKGSTGLAAFIRDDIPDLLFSPSADRLMAIMLECRRWAGFESSLEKSVEKVVETEADESNIPFLEKLLSAIDFKEVKDISGLESKIMQSLKRACEGSRLHWPIVAAVVENPTSHGELSDRIFLSLVDSLSEDKTALEALHGLSQIVPRGQTALQRFRSGVHGSKLLAKLLYLTESPTDEIANLAESLEKKIKGMVAKDTSTKSNVEILQHSFSEVSTESLSVESLVNIAEDLLQNAAPEERPQVAASILPSQESWKTALEPFLGLPPRPSTAITGVLGGVVYLVDREPSDSSRQRLDSVPRDSDRCSSAFRLASYVTKILSSSNIVESLRPEERNILFYYLPLVIRLIDDDLSIEGCNGITGLEMSEEREVYTEIVSQGRSLVNDWIRSKTLVDKENGVSLGEAMSTFWEQKLEALEDTSPESYRVAEAFVRIMSERDSLSTNKSADFLTDVSKQIRTSNVFRSAAWIAVLRPSLVSIPAGTRLCNELISDVTGLDPKNKQSEGLRNLSLLNLLAEGDDIVAASAQTQRLVFLVKHLIQCFQSGIESLNVKAEVIKLLSVVLPKLTEIYGSHWADAMEILNSTWKETSGGDEALTLLYASFKLFGRLRLIANGESNDDFEDAWSESKNDLVRNLISTLRKIDSSTAFHQPRDVTADLLCRLITSIPVESLENVCEIFPLLTAQTRGIQRAAYETLHRYIPKAQEQVSFDVALNKSTARLPDELLSLLREAPTMESISSSLGEEKTWTRLRSYLLSWKVVFDHFSNASLPVQENYASHIKENDILSPLLEFAFDFLQKSHGKLVDASKFDIRSFEPEQSESPEKETQWLLIHLYFLSLKYLSNLTKTWWIDSKKRIKGVVETWTEKYISPSIIEDSLKSVSDWIATQDPDEERALSVKVSPKTAELVASIPVDEESPPVAISISLPPAFPLQPAMVTGRSRVLVDEKKWKSWVLTIQGVIMFSNGNLVDGLLAFRKNVQGALKGQSECAICYSVISTDMQTPNKRCATCKNTFHSVCLFRWFKSSNQSTCPLCRNNFVYV